MSIPLASKQAFCHFVNFFTYSFFNRSLRKAVQHFLQFDDRRQLWMTLIAIASNVSPRRRSHAFRQFPYSASALLPMQTAALARGFCLSVCPSVLPSHSGVLFRRVKMPSCGFQRHNRFLLVTRCSAIAKRPFRRYRSLFSIGGGG